MLRRLWNDEEGAIVSMEVLVIATILGIGLMAAWAAVRNAVVMQIEDQAEWITGGDLEDVEFVPPTGEGNSGFLVCSDIDD